jgi:hypothetical protein
MRITLNYITPLVVGAAAAAAIVAAPTAVADPDPGQPCIDTGSATQCQSPGNSQIVAIPGDVAPGDSGAPSEGDLTAINSTREH